MYVALNNPAEAIAPLERALRLRGTDGDPMSIAEIQFELARALWGANRDRVRARELARPRYRTTRPPAISLSSAG